MNRPTRENQTSDLASAIKETAWSQIGRDGASSLSLRSIARQLRITAPAIYNYFADRDALVTSLIVDAYSSLGASQAAALTSSPTDDPRVHLGALGLAYREWAVMYPQRYQLIFGAPIPRYRMPDDIAFPSVAHAMVPLTTTLQALHVSRRLIVKLLPPLTKELRGMLSAWSERGGHIAIEVLYLTIVIWSRVHGLVTLEINHQLPPVLQDPGEIFRREIQSLLLQYIGPAVGREAKG